MKLNFFWSAQLPIPRSGVKRYLKNGISVWKKNYIFLNRVPTPIYVPIFRRIEHVWKISTFCRLNQVTQMAYSTQQNHPIHKNSRPKKNYFFFKNGLFNAQMDCYIGNALLWSNASSCSTLVWFRKNKTK
jgi:hypothetical protein